MKLSILAFGVAAKLGVCLAPKVIVRLIPLKCVGIECIRATERTRLGSGALPDRSKPQSDFTRRLLSRCRVAGVQRSSWSTVFISLFSATMARYMLSSSLLMT